MEGTLKVQDHMTTKLITVKSNTSLWKAWEMMQTHRIRHLPVIEGKRLVGMITDRDLRQLMPSSLSPPEELERFQAWGTQVKVADVMSRKLFLVTPQTPTREALRIILERRVGCTPVIRGSTLVGILTTRDLLWAMAGQLAPKALAPKKQQARRSPSVRARGTPRAKAKSQRR
jgi:acetoin utilization protein AcuB